MSPDLQQSKALLRKQMLAQLALLSAQARDVASSSARLLLEKQARWLAAESILFFAPQPGELDVWPLLKTALTLGKTVGLPRFDATNSSYEACRIRDCSRDLASGRFGIREPNSTCSILPLNRLDFILVPGVAFDLGGRRLGRGQGYYDQMLAAVGGTTCGVGFDEQIVAEVPVGPRDVSLNCLLTPTRWIEP
jgi:5-formyltetrahydrofolate cyclo-ligase